MIRYAWKKKGINKEDKIIKSFKLRQNGVI